MAVMRDSNGVQNFENQFPLTLASCIMYSYLVAESLVGLGVVVDGSYKLPCLARYSHLTSETPSYPPPHPPSFRISAGPICRIQLPHYLPAGLHGSFSRSYLGPTWEEGLGVRWRLQQQTNQIRGYDG